jgi:hypothetical protein
LFIVAGDNDEYLSGMTYDEMAGGGGPPDRDDTRRYQF